MKHRKVPRWVEAATTPRPARAYVTLTDLVGRLEVRCEPCGRRGVYRVDRLIAELGEVSVGEALEAIARKAQCPRALNPPGAYDTGYADVRCQIKRVVS